MTVEREKKAAVGASELIELATTILLLYWAAHPDAFREISERACELWEGLKHRYSVWQAVQAIRGLPERRANGGAR